MHARAGRQRTVRHRQSAVEDGLQVVGILVFALIGWYFVDAIL